MCVCFFSRVHVQLYLQKITEKVLFLVAVGGRSIGVQLFQNIEREAVFCKLCVHLLMPLVEL